MMALPSIVSMLVVLNQFWICPWSSSTSLSMCSSAKPYRMMGLPAKRLCVLQMCWWASGCLSPLAFGLHCWLATLLAAPRKGEQNVSLPLLVHSLSTASPVHYLLMAAGVSRCCKAPEPNCKGEISITQW